MKRNFFKLLLPVALCVILLSTAFPSVGAFGEYLYQYTGIDWLLPHNSVVADTSPYSPKPGYCYSTLVTKEEQDLYGDLLSAIADMRGYVRVKGHITVDRLRQIYYYAQADVPQFFYNDGYSYTKGDDGYINGVYLKYDCDFDTAVSMWQQVEDVMATHKAALDKIDSHYDKSFYINDLLCDTVTYDSEAENRYSLYGALIEGKAVCSGYAKAAQLLYYSQNINSVYVRGESLESRHGWNLVQLNDTWYHVDVTWNDAIRRVQDQQDTYFYTYLHLSDEIIYANHDPFEDENPILPSCTSMELNYFYKNGLVASTQNEAINIAAAEAVKSFKEGDYIIDFMITDDVNIKTFIDSGMSQAYKQIRQKMGYSPVSSSYSYSHNKEIGTVRIYFKVK